MIVRAGILYDGTLEPPKRNVDIVVNDGRIEELRVASGQCDLEAACVTPGLVNAHAHLEASGEPDMMGMISTTTRNQRLLRAVENARKLRKTVAMRWKRGAFRDRVCVPPAPCSA